MANGLNGKNAERKTLSRIVKFLVTFLVTTRTLLVPMRGCIQCKSRSRPNTSERLAPALWSRARRKKKGKRRNGGAHTETGGEGRPRGVRRPLNRPRVAIVLRRMTSLSMTSRRRCGRGIRVLWPYYWLGGGWSGGHDEGLHLPRERQMARRVRSTLPGMLSARILPTLSCPTGPSTTLRAIDDGQVERARRWASPRKCSRARPSARARPSGIARGGSGAESPFREARTSSRVDRGSPCGSFPARRGAVSSRGGSCGSTRGSPEVWRWPKRNRAAPNQTERNVNLPSGVPSTILAARRLFSGGGVGTSVRLVEDDVRLSE